MATLDISQGASGASTAKRPGVGEGVYQKLRREILICRLRPGVTLHEQDLAQRYRVSKSPIRDALLRLQEQNLIEVLPRKGYRVAPVSVADAGEMYEMRLLLECACATRAIDHASDTELASLDAFRTIRRGATLEQWVEYNRRFHLALAQTCGNRRLAGAATDVAEHFDRLTHVGLIRLNRDALGGFVDEHCAIIDALQRRDRRAATSLIRSHIGSSRKRALASISRAEIVP
jgi:DNA-binding GntR family transcriptional regulator